MRCCIDGNYVDMPETETAAEAVAAEEDSVMTRLESRIAKLEAVQTDIKRLLNKLHL